MAKARDVRAHEAAHARDVEKLWPLQVVALMVAYRRAVGRDPASTDEVWRWAQALDANGHVIDLFQVFDTLSLDEQTYVREQLASKSCEHVGTTRPGMFQRISSALHRSIRP